MLKQCVKFKFYVLIHSITYAQLQPYYFLFCLFCFICLTTRYKEQDLSVVCIGIAASYLLDPNYILIIILYRCLIIKTFFVFFCKLLQIHCVKGKAVNRFHTKTGIYLLVFI